MPDIASLLQQGVANYWLFIPAAILLGALHGLEPGHSKTMMAAFIIAIRGTVTQATLLGLSATISHTAIVWIIALAGLHFGKQWNMEANEPYFQIVSGVLILGVAFWMIIRTWKHRRDHDGGHSHDHDHDHHHEHGYHHHEHHAPENEGLDLVAPGYQDPHELAHADDIRRRFANKHVTTGQIIIFGLTGGLIPCPATITVLLICLQLKKVVLGAMLVLCFSVGLALTMVTTGTIAALSVKHVSKRFSGFGHFVRKAPYMSGALIILVGLYIGYQGLRAII